MTIGKVAEMGRTVRIIAPLLLAVAVLLAAMPWGMDESRRIVLPLAVAALILAVVSRRPDALPPWLVLPAGIVFDSVTLAPLGLWTLVWLAAMAAGCLLHGGEGGQVRRAAGSMAGMALVTAFYWALASLYQWTLVDWRPVAVAGGGLAVLLPLVAAAAVWLVGSSTRRGPLRLERST